MVKSIAVATAILALSASAAQANIIIVSGSVPGNPDENVLLNTGVSGTTIFGTTNQTGSSVTIVGSEILTEPSNGQARVEAADGGYTGLNFFLTNPALAFGRAEFNINAATNGSVTINATDQLGNPFSGTFALGSNGQNFFNLTGANGELIKNISFTSTAQVSDTRQIRIGGVTALGGGPVPEPATWAMMILGFGMVGAGLRIGRRNPRGHAST